MIDNYRSLLKDAALIYEKHEAGRKEPFNIFTVLHKETDEVNLHSRFLHALLDHQSSDTRRQNLKDFLQRVGIEDFEQNDAKIRREYRNIDILISNNTTNQAVVIENKIKEIKYRKDEPQQLQRYYKILQEEGYRNICLLYLTLDGHDPSEDSVGNLPYKTISYRDDLLPWLRCCQMHAYDEPELWESIAQYIHLIRKLTGTDFEEAYMNELRDLLLEENNLVLIHHLDEAITRTKIYLLYKLWCEIESALKIIKKQIPDFPDKDEDLSDISKEKVKKYVKGERGHNLLLYYRVSTEDRDSVLQEAQVHLVVRLDKGASYYNIYFGVLCDGNEYIHDALRNALNALNSYSERGFPWYKYADEDLNFNNLNRETLGLLSNERERKKFADGIADGLKEVWEQMKEANLA